MAGPPASGPATIGGALVFATVNLFGTFVFLISVAGVYRPDKGQLTDIPLMSWRSPGRPAMPHVLGRDAVGVVSAGPVPVVVVANNCTDRPYTVGSSRPAPKSKPIAAASERGLL